MIGLHSGNPAVYHTLLEETPRSRESRTAHDEFETEYMRRYEALISASQRARSFASPSIAAQVLSAAIAGVVHDAARRGTLASPALKQELVHMITAYLCKPRRTEILQV